MDEHDGPRELVIEYNSEEPVTTDGGACGISEGMWPCLNNLILLRPLS